jgi:hypothetical protein
MKLKTIYSLGILSTLLIFSSCSNSSKIKGEWMRSDYKGTLKITDEKVIFDNITEKDYVVDKNTLKVVTYGISDNYQFDFKGDTLILTKDKLVQKFIPKGKVSSDEEQIKTLLTPQVEKTFEKKIATLELKKEHWGDLKEKITLQKTLSIPDEEWVYLAEATFDNKITPPAILFIRAGRNKANVLQPAWVEILESSTRRYLVTGMGIPAEKVVLTPNKGKGFDILAITNDGSELPLILDPQAGVFPKQDNAAISSYFHYSMKKKYGEEIIQKVNFEKNEATNSYEGIMTLQNTKDIKVLYSQQKGLEFLNLDEESKELLAKGMVENDLGVELVVESAEVAGDFLKLVCHTKSNENLVAFADLLRGWYPENTVTSLATATRYRIQKKIGNSAKVNSVLLAQRSAERYEGIVDYSIGASEKITVEHKGTGFTWRPALETDKYLK